MPGGGRGQRHQQGGTRVTVLGLGPGQHQQRSEPETAEELEVTMGSITTQGYSIETVLGKVHHDLQVFHLFYL